MPRRDETGPMGAGPMTGRGVGLCAGSALKEGNEPVKSFSKGVRRGFACGFGGGFGRGFGRGGYGRRNFAQAGCGAGWQGNFTTQIPVDKQQQLAALRSHAGYLESSLRIIKEKLAEFEE